VSTCDSETVAGFPQSGPSVAFMIVSLVRGGAQKQVRELAIRLPDAGWKVAGVISLLPLKDEADELREQGIPVFSLGMRSKLHAPVALVRAARLLRRLDPDVLLTFLFHASALGSLVGRVGGGPAVVSSLRSERFGGRTREVVFRLLSGLRHGTIVNSALVTRSLLDRGLVRAETNRMIPNGIEVLGEPRGTSKPSRSALGVPEDGFLWLAVGSLLPAKDYPTLLQAFAHIEGHNARLVVAGGGHLDRELQLLCNKLQIQDRVEFLGLRNDIPELLHAADAFVSSSAWEGMPNAVMEAMAAGKPIVATEVGGVPELVEPNQTGLLVPPGQSRVLAKAMLRVMSMPPEERRELGARARASVTSTYGWETVVQQWNADLREIISATNRVPPKGSSDERARAHHH